MGSVHFIGGEKGGVGKSLTARLLAQYCVDGGRAFIGFDSDQSHGSFTRFYSEFAKPLNTDDFASLDRIVEAAEEQPARDIIVDLAAQTAGRLAKWIDDSDVFSILEELGFNVYLWHVMDDGADSMNLLDKLLTRYTQPELKIIVVQNLGRGESFEHFEHSAVQQKAAERGAGCVVLAKLQTQLSKKIDFNNFSFWNAAHNRDAMTITERQRVRVWLKNQYAQFDRVLQPAIESMSYEA